MTHPADQQDAQPTPTPGQFDCAICGEGGFRSIGFGTKYTHDYFGCALGVAAERDRLKVALKQIAAFAMLDEMDDEDRDFSEIEFGLQIEEIIEMGHDNMVSIARAALLAHGPVKEPTP